MSRILANVHETVRDLHEVGVVDERTMREFDALCPPPLRHLDGDDVRRIRARAGVSQAVLAAYLGVGKTTVRQWEQGLKRPGGSSRRLLDMVEHKGLAAII